MTVHEPLELQAGRVAADDMAELIRRVNDLNNAYRSLAEKAGQLYMKADEFGLSSMTALLDKPMRNASDNQQAFSALLADLQMHMNGQGPQSSLND